MTLLYSYRARRDYRSGEENGDGERYIQEGSQSLRRTTRGSARTSRPGRVRGEYHRATDLSRESHSDEQENGVGPGGGLMLANRFPSRRAAPPCQGDHRG